ncbi:MAG: hypothetical protein AABX07_05445 [Nanoarchaeota archaeon]
MINKRGLSDVVTTVLIILFSIIAVAIVGGIVLNQISKTGGKIEATTVCNEIDITPTKCFYNDKTTLPAVAALIRRGADNVKFKITSITLIAETASGKDFTRTLPRSLNSLDSFWGVITEDSIRTDFPLRFKVGYQFQNSKGKLIDCAPLPTSVKCVNNGGDYATGVSPPASVTLTIVNGVATNPEKNSYNPASIYEANTIATLVQSNSKLGRATVLITKIDKNTPSDIKMSILDGNVGADKWDITQPTAEIK